MSSGGVAGNDASTQTDLSMCEFECDQVDNLADAWIEGWTKAHERSYKIRAEYVRQIDQLRLERQERLEQHNRTIEACELRLRSVQAELEDKRLSARKNRRALVAAREELNRHRALADDLNQQKDSNATLRARVRKLEDAVMHARLQRGGGRLASAIEKLARCPAAGRRLAAAVHPDKAPADCSEIAAELFKFVQGARESASS